MNQETKKIILKMVQDHDGKWGWYQIDRALSIKGIVGVNVGAAMAQLREEGLVIGDGDVQQASTRYTLTKAGAAALA